MAVRILVDVRVFESSTFATVERNWFEHFEVVDHDDPNLEQKVALTIAHARAKAAEVVSSKDAE